MASRSNGYPMTSKRKPLSIEANLQAEFNGLHIRIFSKKNTQRVYFILESWSDALKIAYAIRCSSYLGNRLKNLHRFGRETDLNFCFKVKNTEVSSIGINARPGLLKLLV